MIDSLKKEVIFKCFKNVEVVVAVLVEFWTIRKLKLISIIALENFKNICIIIVGIRLHKKSRNSKVKALT